MKEIVDKEKEGKYIVGSANTHSTARFHATTEGVVYGRNFAHSSMMVHHFVMELDIALVSGCSVPEDSQFPSLLHVFFLLPLVPHG